MGSRQTARDRAKQRELNRRLVRRSPVLTNGAKVLWLELDDWAWDGVVCFPSQKLLMIATGSKRSSIFRHLKELKAAKILAVGRQQKGNRYIFPVEIPFDVCDPARAINANLVSECRGATSASSDVPKMAHGETRVEKPCTENDTSDVSKMAHDPPTRCSDNDTSHVSKMAHDDDEVLLKEVQEEKEREVQEKEEEPAFRKGTQANQKLEGDLELVKQNEGSTTDEIPSNPKQRVRLKAQVEDPSELMEDPTPKKPPKRRPRKKRAPDKGIVTTKGEARRAVSGRSGSTKSVEVSPPPPKRPEDVLRLLRDEIDEKYGSKGVKGLLIELSPKEKKQASNVLLSRFAPDVVISMIRVLVWDWEVARSTCFPYRHGTPFPTFEALIQYQELLSSAVTTGLKRDGANRGIRNTYRRRYLKDATPIKKVDPF